MIQGRSREHSTPSPTESADKTAQEVLLEFYFLAAESLQKQGISSPDELTPEEHAKVALFLFQLLQKTVGDISEIQAKLPNKAPSKKKVKTVERARQVAKFPLFLEDLQPGEEFVLKSSVANNARVYAVHPAFHKDIGFDCTRTIRLVGGTYRFVGIETRKVRTYEGTKKVVQNRLLAIIRGGSDLRAGVREYAFDTDQQ